MSIELAQAAVTAFNRKHGNRRPDKNTWSYYRQGVLRLQLIQEETAELAEAIFRCNRHDQADALADLLFVVLGTADILNINLEPCFWEVHRSNMTKSSTEDPRVRDKGKDYSPPDISSVLEDAP